MVFDPIIETLFNDAKPDEVQEFIKVAQPHSMHAMESPVAAPLWEDPGLYGRRIAIRTMLDKTFFPVVQDMFIEKSGVEWQVIDIQAGYVLYFPVVERPIQDRTQSLTTDSC